MARPLRIDFVSDVVCPWCMVGLAALEQALANCEGLVTPDWHFQPFELNPDMPPEGEESAAHVARKYGADPERTAATRGALRQAAAELGLEIPYRPGSRIWNSFDCHRLLHWAGTRGRQRELKHALFTAHFSRGEALNDPAVLVAAAVAAGLDPDGAAAVLAGDAHAADVRQSQAVWRDQGIAGVPAIVFDGRALVMGAQPVAVFERVVRRLADVPKSPQIAPTTSGTVPWAGF